jgi:hypothetical protein
MDKQQLQDYYRARVAAERAAAERAETDKARTVHLTIAEEYQRIADGEQDPPTPV